MQVLSKRRTETGRYADSRIRRHIDRPTDTGADMLRAPTGRQTDSCQPDRQMHRARVVTFNPYTRLFVLVCVNKFLSNSAHSDGCF